MASLGAGADWEKYAASRILSRNRLTLAHHAEALDDFIRVFSGVSTGARVLDVGPANGLFLVLLRELGFEAIEGLEISDTWARELARKNLHATVGNVLCGDDVDSLGHRYDVVIMMEVLEHLSDPLSALRNVRRLLDPGGMLYLTVPICDCIFDRMRRLRHSVSRREQVLAVDETHLHAFSIQSLSELLATAGFTITTLNRLSFRAPRRLQCSRNARVFLLLRALLPRGFKGLCVSVTAEPVPGSEA